MKAEPGPGDYGNSQVRKVAPSPGVLGYTTGRTLASGLIGRSRFRREPITPNLLISMEITMKSLEELHRINHTSEAEAAQAAVPYTYADGLENPPVQKVTKRSFYDGRYFQDDADGYAPLDFSEVEINSTDDFFTAEMKRLGYLS
jgi:hypothetical protein